MKTTILALLTIIFAITVNAQSAIEWQNRIGGNGADYLYAVEQTRDGGYILGGYSESGISGDKTEPSIDVSTYWGGDYWIMKLDSLGNIEWQNTIGGDSTDQIWSIEETFDGGFILAGYSNSTLSGDKTENSMGGHDLWVVKLDASGNIQWQNTIGGSGDDGYGASVIIRQTTDSGYILGTSSQSNISGDKTENRIGFIATLRDYWVLKLDSTGNIQWQNTIGGDGEDVCSSIRQTVDGGYILGGGSSSSISGDKTENLIASNGRDYWILKLDAAGNIEWQNTIGGDATDQLESIELTADSGYVVAGNSSSGISGDKTENPIGSSDFWILKLDASGNIEWQNTIGGSNNDAVWSVRQTIDRGYILAGYSTSDISGDKTENNLGIVNSGDGWIVKLDASGNVQWENTIGGSGGDNLFAIQQVRDGGFIVGGWTGSPVSGDIIENSLGDSDYWVIKLKTVTNLITGNVFNDVNTNCSPDSSEKWFRYFTVMSTPFQNCATADYQGNYELWVDTGSYSVQLLTNHPFLNLQCPSVGSYNVNFTSQGDTAANKDFGLETTIYCPWMQIFTCPFLLRTCRSTSYNFRYCNNGTLPASNVYIELVVDPLLTVDYSSIPWRTPQAGNTYIFDIGDVGIGECGSFYIGVTVSCSTVIGQTICVQAHIFPDTICIPPSVLWDSSTVEVDGQCVNNDTVKFRIANTGAGDMQDSLYYYIVEDNVMLRNGKFKLLAAQSLDLFEMAKGSTFRLEAQQSLGHPNSRNPSVTVERCGINGMGGVSLGFVTTFPQHHANPFVYTYCEEIVGSYDPNDKTSYPKGVGNDKIISADTELEYKIRFQNTGNDTAFRVVIRDTLSPYLDIATIELGASSHPYDFRIYGTRILEWTFDNILLPDSFVNEPESHGFVQFRVMQIPNNPEGTVIENSADIYFDFNAPVKTNVEFNTVGDINEVLLSVIENVDLHNNISIYPNPFSEYFIVEIDGKPAKLLQFEVYDMQGRMNGKREFQFTKKFIVNNLNLSTSIYFYRIIADGKVIGAGKILGM